MSESVEKTPVVSKALLGSFILVTCLFALWGFANDITNPLVAAFKGVMELSNAESTWIQAAFYGGYATMAIPAALFIRKFSYKAGILLGLTLYATGALLFIPAAVTMKFVWFPVSLYILTFGLAFLETTANPFILSMGDERTATQRLNLAQAFNPIGSLMGMVVASKLILAKLSTSQFRTDWIADHPESATMGAAELNEKVAAAYAAFKAAQPDVFAANQVADVAIIRNPYAILGVVVLIMFVVFVFKKFPAAEHKGEQLHPIETARRLFSTNRWWEGVIAQTFYVAAQITCWTFVIQYAMENVPGMTLEKAQNYNIGAMVLFLVSRFICTFLLKYLSAGKLLMQLAALAGVLMLCTIFLQNYAGLLCLIGISGCMSLMFPTIYGIALDGLGEDAKLGSAGLVFAIVGGAAMPLAMGKIMDGDGIGMLNAVSTSFFMPFVSFVIIAIFGFRTYTVHHRK
ncbi:L-fucose-proton symporter [Pontiella desulfatans]|uniref:L-fucose-proton symporter n=1 Tax=Pontiella desulfatans TaxID=2750659 RepID=A0A6C2U8E8_PONDE|nr:L-fucose:H+ symporter permease [Pontiella desulfatans]VGO16378.1 L-fucose-proton symporter [Pontiella desulfatans]